MTKSSRYRAVCAEGRYPRVVDSRGRWLCDCASEAVAALIADALNALSTKGSHRCGPGSVMIRPHRIRGVKVEWPDAPLNDIPRKQRLESLRRAILTGDSSGQPKPLDRSHVDRLRRRFERRLRSLKRPDAAKRLRDAFKAPARVRGRLLTEVAAVKRDMQKTVDDSVTYFEDRAERKPERRPRTRRRR